MPRSRQRPPEPQPEFFVDRSLGRLVVPGALRSLGFVVYTMADVYPNGADESVEDERWIRDADHAGWVALTKDERLTRYASEQAALEASTLRLFAIANQNLTGPQMAQLFERHIHRIIQRSRRPGPFVDVLLADRVDRRWPR